VVLEPEERTDAADALKLHDSAATGHDSPGAAPAGFVIEVRAIHVKVLADLLDLALIAGKPLVKRYKIEVHARMFIITEGPFKDRIGWRRKNLYNF
jgi:hypothetical protein